MKTTAICIHIWRAIAAQIWNARLAWACATERWFPFKDCPDWLVQAWAHSTEPKDDDIILQVLAAAREEWALRKRRRNRQRTEVMAA